MFFIVVTHVISLGSWGNLSTWKSQLLNQNDTSRIKLIRSFQMPYIQLMIANLQKNCDI